MPSSSLVARHGSRARKMGIPLVPFLAFGAVVALFSGGAILDWYLGIDGASGPTLGTRGGPGH